MKRISTILATLVGFSVLSLNAPAFADQRDAASNAMEAPGFDLRISIDEHPYPTQFGNYVD